MYIGNIIVTIEPYGTQHKFIAMSKDTEIAVGVVDTFTFNHMTGVFYGGNMKITGVKSVKL